MEFLYENNYSVIPLTEVRDHLNKKTNSENHVVLTFDDGFKDFYTSAFSELNKYGFPATVFISTGFIDEPSKTKYLNWSEVIELSKENIDFGSHTVTHPKLALLDRRTIESELAASKIKIEKKIGKKINSFSYPFAFPETDTEYIKFLRHTLLKTGYKIGVTTKIGTTKRQDDILLLKRIPVNSNDDRLLFKSKLEGGYNWLSFFQYLSKLMKRIAN